MKDQFADLSHEVHILELELRKLELLSKIDRLRSKPPIDDDCVGCAGPCDVAAKLRQDLEDTKDKNVEDMKELYDYDQQEVSRLKYVVSDLDLLIKRFENSDCKLRFMLVDRHTEMQDLKQDSEVLSKVVESLIDWQADPMGPRAMISRLCRVVSDYLITSDHPIEGKTDAVVKIAFLELP